MKAEDVNDRGSSKEEQERNFHFLSQAGSGMDVTVRDDHYEFSWLLDAVHSCRKKNGRFRLIDSGKTEGLQLEWLLEAGADLFTSSNAVREEEELVRFATACRKGRAVLAYFHQEAVLQSEKKNDVDRIDLMKLGRCGIYIHLSDKEAKNDPAELEKTAFSCRKGGSWLVYYHRGVLEKSLGSLTENGAWIHILSDRIQNEEHVMLVKDITAAARSMGSNMIIHSDGPAEWNILEDLIEEKVVFIPKTRCFDYKSPYKFLEKVIARTRLPFQSYYLYPDIML